MRETLKKILDDLGVGYELSPYETCPWAAFDDEKGLMISAEVRMNPDGDEIEAEMQIMRERPEKDQKTMEQVYWLIAGRSTADKWDVKDVRIRGEGNTENKYGWVEKSMAFFRACVQEMKMGNVPDIEDILAREMKSTERFGGAAGGGGSKSPKIKPQALLGMKTGRGA